MNFLLDRGLPRSTVQHLQAVGIKAEHIGGLGLATASGKTILDEARDRGAIIVTLESDFHALLALSNASSPSVIRVHMQGLRGEGAARIIQKVIDPATNDLVAGAAVTVTDRRLALRRLPLIAKNDSEPNDETAS